VIDALNLCERCQAAPRRSQQANCRYCESCRLVVTREVEERARARYRVKPSWKAASMRATRKYEYGISDDAYQALVQAEDGRCAICKEAAKLHLDHDHQTGKIRGLLCGACNRAIGMMQDNPARLRAAAAYLEER